MLIVSDTTPIISLIKVNRLDLLKTMFQEVIIPQAVYNELVCNLRFADEADIVKNCDFLKVASIQDTDNIALLRETEKLDAGESEAIILSQEQVADILLMDEHRGRQVAKRMGINIVGTIGILLQAYDEKLLSRAEILDRLECMQRNKIRISKTLMEYVENYILQDK